MKCPYTVNDFLTARKLRPECAPQDEVVRLVNYFNSNASRWLEELKKYRRLQGENLDVLRCLIHIRRATGSSEIPHIPNYLFGKFYNKYIMSVLTIRRIKDILRRHKKPMDISTYKKLKSNIAYIEKNLNLLRTWSQQIKNIVARYGYLVGRFSSYCVKMGNSWMPISPNYYHHHHYRHRHRYRYLHHHHFISNRCLFRRCLAHIPVKLRHKYEQKHDIHSDQEVHILSQKPTIKQTLSQKNQKVTKKPVTNVVQPLAVNEKSSSLDKYLPILAGAGLLAIVLANRG